MFGLSVMSSALHSAVCRIDTEIDIPASPEQVWETFGDFASWGNWNDFMVLPEVPEAVGKHCSVLFKLDGGSLKHSKHTPEILVLEKNKELRWRDYRGPILSLFFRGSHWWVLEPLPNGHTRFVHGAEMQGFVVPFLHATMEAIKAGYIKFNQALADEVDASSKRHNVTVASHGVSESEAEAEPVAAADTNNE